MSETVSRPQRILALDVGAKRIGLAFATADVRIATVVGTVQVSPDGLTDALAEIYAVARRKNADVIVAGLPRNNRGETTRQTESVQSFIIALKEYFVKHKHVPANADYPLPTFVFQDESWTSEVAKEHLRASATSPTPRRARAQGLIDAEASAVILQDYLEKTYFTARQAPGDRPS